MPGTRLTRFAGAVCVGSDSHASRGAAQSKSPVVTARARTWIMCQSSPTPLACGLTQPRVAAHTQRCLQLSDSADDLERTKPILAKPAPYSHWLCLLLHLVSHLSTGPLEKTS